MSAFAGPVDMYSEKRYTDRASSVAPRSEMGSVPIRFARRFEVVSDDPDVDAEGVPGPG